jgi:hypothetical protein
MTLNQLRLLDAGHAAEGAWKGQFAEQCGPCAGRPCAGGPCAGGPCAGGPTTGPGATCDATIIPIVTGTVDEALVNELTAALLEDQDRADPAEAGRRNRAQRSVRQILVRAAADLLSGPSGLTAYLRTGLLSSAAGSPSLVLDIGTASDTVPAHLRRAVIARDQRCRFPGCDQPAAACQPHHLVPRASGGRHSLTNLLLLCSFHHLIAVHRWGWTVTLHPDATVTATNPGGTRVFHGHGPPATAA